MQWLINLIKKWVIAQGYATIAWVQAQGYLTTSYVDRGDHASKDFGVGSFTDDYNWHPLDLSGIIPVDAVLVNLTVLVRNSGVGRALRFRKSGNVNTYNKAELITQVSNISFPADMSATPGPLRIIEYWLSAGGWAIIDVNVKGWWV